MKKLLIVMLVLVMGLTLALSGCANKERVTLDDIEYTSQLGELWSVELILTCNKSVEDLAIDYIAYNEAGIVVKTSSKFIGKVTAQKAYKINLFVVSLTDTIKVIEVTAVSGKVIKAL